MGFLENFAAEFGRSLLEHAIKAGGRALHKGSVKTSQDVLTVNRKTIPYTLAFNEKRHELKALIAINNWNITVDWYRYELMNTSRVYTRIRAPFLNTRGLRFTIYSKIGWRDVFKETHEGSIFPIQDIRIGNAPFDEKFIIQGNNEDGIRELFASPKIRRLMQSQEHLYLKVKEGAGWFSTKGDDELYFQVEGCVANDERLGSLVELFVATLNRLRRLGLASNRVPK